MKNIFLVTVIWAIGLSGCSESDNAEINLSSYERSGKYAVKAKLRDEDSTEFRNIFTKFLVYKGKKVVVSCGEVNAKNTLGAYAGFEGYVYINYVSLKKSAIFLERETADFETIRILCL